ncbi:MAG: DUF4349 domain-containing protein [Nanoarchaeota archaeon]|nr:DUF4349 domain-containing protein [Nanoarchaeota archaeon]
MTTILKNLKDNWKNYALVLLLLAFLFTFLANMVSVGDSSFQTDSLSNKGMYYNTQESVRYYPGSSDFAPLEEDRKLIKNARIELESGNYDGVKSNLDSSVNAHNVIVLSSNERKYNDYRSLNYNFKVPSEKLDLFLGELESYGEVISLNVNTNDQTGSYVDFKSRIERYENQMASYENMLLRGNMDIEDEIKIHKRIDQIEDSIFYLKKNIGSIDEQTLYSDVYLTLKEKESFFAEIDFIGIRDGFKLFLESLEFAIKVIFVLVGFLLPFGIIYMIYRLIKNIGKRK